jgi:hypothetical protein
MTFLGIWGYFVLAVLKSTTATLENGEGLSFVTPTNRLSEVGQTAEQYGQFWRNCLLCLGLARYLPEAAWWAVIRQLAKLEICTHCLTRLLQMESGHRVNFCECSGAVSSTPLGHREVC